MSCGVIALSRDFHRGPRWQECFDDRDPKSSGEDHRDVTNSQTQPKLSQPHRQARQDRGALLRDETGRTTTK